MCDDRFEMKHVLHAQSKAIYIYIGYYVQAYNIDDCPQK